MRLVSGWLLRLLGEGSVVWARMSLFGFYPDLWTFFEIGNDEMMLQLLGEDAHQNNGRNYIYRDKDIRRSVMLPNPVRKERNA